MFKSLLKTIIIIIVFTFDFIAQNSETKIQVYGIGSIPIGPYGETIGSSIELTRKSGLDYGSDVGLAIFGYGIGAEISSPVLIDGLAWQFGTKFLLNPTDNSDVTEAFSSDVRILNDLVLKTGNWINIPIVSGFSYGINLFSKFNFYLQLQAGINISDQPERKATYQNVIVEEVKYNTLVDFAFETAISIDYDEFYTLSVRYINLNSPRYEGTRYLNEKLFPEISTRNFIIAAEEKPVEMLLFTFGLKF
ncbi:MAG: hypothetical protein IPM32_13910 [Ignavibacteriae bacterium]|nr:hypothetical protein [Ignavibacteriota bacterium]